ncbi:IS701 family transposase [Kistimonas asteriae]|uniref:IS701 family transposase n=1 Tax=Kistimonas asteriae TaxID=517724 RepID=UPI001BAC9338|nr:transposase [Kistimonas asteriae]
MKHDLIELYSDYLLSSFGKTTATGLSNLSDDAYSHDQVTRLLSTNQFTSRTLWGYVKPVVRQVEKPDGVLIFDDTIQEKPYSKENALNTYHFDHTKNRTVKGINLLNAHYHAGDASILVAYELIEKTIQYTDLKTKKIRRKAERTKNQMLRDMVKVCCQNNLLFRYVLADSWFCSNENMMFIRHDCGKHFLMAMKSNRKVSLSLEDKQQGRSQRIDTVDFSEGEPVEGWIAGIDFPVLLFRQVFKNKDGSTGILYLVCSDLECDAESLKTIYKKRWKVEVFHKTLKSNASMAKSPAHTVKTQSNHVFLSIYSAFRLETLSLKLKINHFQLRAKIYMTALRASFEHLRLFVTA